ncbi:MAG: HAD-IIB family hydrolase [Desulfohalobiaceae bacterium]|nr:HAD-IIB family hydrolase [Desulfohalobiaceae bacterium]
MIPFDRFRERSVPDIGFVLTDIDDTLTLNGRLPAVAFQALEDLETAGIRTVPITGRPAGWCDHIARMWPVAGVVGENGAFSFAYDQGQKRMNRFYWKTEEERRADKKKLDNIRKEVLHRVPGCRVSADQPFREADLAIDFCEDVPRLSAEEIHRIVDCFERAGARAKISSIHVNGWFGDYDKLSMTRLFFDSFFRINLDDCRKQTLFIGDSPNDCPMFEFFPNSVGVANIRQFSGELSAEPTWITSGKGGFGFAQVAKALLDRQRA